MEGTVRARRRRRIRSPRSHKRHTRAKLDSIGALDGESHSSGKSPTPPNGSVCTPVARAHKRFHQPRPITQHTHTHAALTPTYAALTHACGRSPHRSTIHHGACQPLRARFRLPHGAQAARRQPAAAREALAAHAACVGHASSEEVRKLGCMGPPCARRTIRPRALIQRVAPLIRTLSCSRSC